MAKDPQEKFMGELHRKIHKKGSQGRNMGNVHKERSWEGFTYLPMERSTRHVSMIERLAEKGQERSMRKVDLEDLLVRNVLDDFSITSDKPQKRRIRC